jgi:hypothetical protein
VPNTKIIELYAIMAAITEPLCGKTCSTRPPKSPYRCCSPEYCDFAAQYAKEEFNITLQATGNTELRFMGPNGCTVDPYLRPMCTMHVCDVNAFGFLRSDLTFMEIYDNLRAKINHEAIKDLK